MPARQERDPVVEGPPTIVLEVPLRADDVADEALHLGLVGNQPAVQMTRIPVDQDPAQVEHGRGGAVRGG